MAQAHVSRHSGLEVIRSADARENRADRGPRGEAAVIDVAIVIAGHEPVRTAAMSAIGVGERADERHLVGDAGHLGKRTAERLAGNFCFYFARHAAVRRRRRHLRIEGFHMRRSAQSLPRILLPHPNDDHSRY